MTRSTRPAVVASGARPHVTAVFNYVRIHDTVVRTIAQNRVTVEHPTRKRHKSCPTAVGRPAVHKPAERRNSSASCRQSRSSRRQLPSVSPTGRWPLGTQRIERASIRNEGANEDNFASDTACGDSWVKQLRRPNNERGNIGKLVPRILTRTALEEVHIVLAELTTV